METDINIRKINLVKKVLELKDEFFLDKINEAEKDFENNNFFSSKELLKELDL